MRTLAEQIRSLTSPNQGPRRHHKPGRMREGVTIRICERQASEQGYGNVRTGGGKHREDGDCQPGSDVIVRALWPQRGTDTTENVVPLRRRAATQGKESESKLRSSQVGEDCPITYRRVRLNRAENVSGLKLVNPTISRRLHVQDRRDQCISNSHRPVRKALYTLTVRSASDSQP